MPSPRLIVPAFICALGLVVLATTAAGCGGGRGDKTLSSEGYAAAVTRLCASNGRELGALFDPRPNFLARKGDALVEVAGRNIARLKRLRPPPELERKSRVLILDAEATHDRLIRIVQIAKKRPGAVDLANKTLIDARRRMIRAASAVGAVC